MERLLQHSDGSLHCTCGSKVFTTMGDIFCVTIIECAICNNRTSILGSSLIAEKLLSPLGEDYCKVFGRFDKDMVMVDHLIFTEFQTKITISVSERLNNIRLAKVEAINNGWFERAARLREEEKIAECILRQLDKYR